MLIDAEGELVDLVDEFSDGRIQFAFVKVKDSNSGLPKSALIAWCGEGVPERTKGYFTSHMTAVAKLLHVSDRYTANTILTLVRDIMFKSRRDQTETLPQKESYRR